MQFQKLNKNDKIGLITPASYITKQKLDNSIQNLKNFGFKAHFFDSVSDKTGYLAGSDNDRADELHKMYKDKSVKAILCVRGGYGTARILDLINYELIKQNPKPLIGYSDITALLSAIYKKTGQIGFHGVVGASIFNEFTANNFYDIFLKKTDVIHCKVQKEMSDDSYMINSGKVSGKLVGGNLAILNSLLGTPYDLDWTDKIVFIEEIGEVPYRIDRLLTQLISAGKFNKAKGIVFGLFNKCEGKDFNEKMEDTFLLKDIINEKIKPLGIPAAYGFPFGHIDNQIILPIGAEANFNADKMQISVKKDFFQ